MFETTNKRSHIDENPIIFVDIFRLPEDTIMWFEPPTVCRWEWPEETNYSERRKNAKKSKTKFKHKQSKPPRIIEDFNLFNIPSGLDMYSIMQEFVVPRLPNGYSIKIHRVVGDRRRSSLLRSTRKGWQRNL